MKSKLFKRRNLTAVFALTLVFASLAIALPPLAESNPFSALVKTVFSVEAKSEKIDENRVESGSDEKIHTGLLNTQNCSVLDDFNRADSTNMGANWTETSGSGSIGLPSDTTQTITQSGIYRITVRGADGGRKTFNNLTGGFGATVSASFDLLAGDSLTLVTGIAGGVAANGGGGGGGSAVILTRGATQTLLIAAGGGGGAGSSNGLGGSSAQGTAGGGAAGGFSGGGGGFNSNGGNSQSGGGGAGTLSGGGAGGNGANSGGNGGYGFGGGSGAFSIAGGAGGGYQGGAGRSNGAGGFGGLSFIDASGTDAIRTDGANGSGNGQDGQNGSVVITEPTILTVTKTADTNDGVCDADCSLREAITAANNDAANNTINFSPAVFNTARTITLGGSELIIENNGTLTIDGPGAGMLTVSGNNASRVFYINSGANATISGLTISGGNGIGSDIQGFGGGINNFGTLTLTNSTVSNNSVEQVVGNGGGILNNPGSTLNITNSTVSGNSAIGGGGIFNGGTLNITNSTVSNNSASTGGGIFNNNGTLNAVNTIISGNTATAIPDLRGSLTTDINNLIGNFANVRLAPLGFYGGTTQTHALLSGSTAINAGTSTNAPTDDQRGASRVGAVDIGAFELNNSTYVAQLPNGTQFFNYQYQLVPNNGAFTYTVSGGALPNGITLSTNFAPDAVVALSGNPQESGIFNFAITASDGTNSNVTNYQLNILGPTAANVSVSGRVLTPTGRGLRNAVVTMTDSSGETRTARTSTFGYYRFTNVGVGETYVFEVRSKQFQFAAQVVNVGEDLTELNFKGSGQNL